MNDYSYISFRNHLSCVHNCDDHSLTISSALQMYEFSCVYFQISPRTTASRIAPQAANSGEQQNTSLFMLQEQHLRAIWLVSESVELHTNFTHLDEQELQRSGVHSIPTERVNTEPLWKGRMEHILPWIEQHLMVP